MIDKTLLGTLVAGACLFVSTGIYAEPPQMPRPNPKNIHALERFKDTLQLSDTQVKEIESLNKLFREKYKSHKDKLKPLEDRLRELEKADTPDYVQIEQVLSTIAPIHTSLRIDKIRHHHQLMQILTNEQRNKWKDTMKEKREKMRLPKFDDRPDMNP